MTEFINIASFDMGTKNFAFCIEKVNKTKLSNIKSCANKYHPNGTPTDEMNTILEEVYKSGEIVLFKNINISQNCDNNDLETLSNMTKALDEYTDYWNDCSIVLIEQQMDFGKCKRNPIAVRLQHHCYSYFLIKHDMEILDYPAYHKTQILGCPKAEGKPYKNGSVRWKAIDKPKRKKWAVEKAIEILNCRNEYNILKSMKKKDDLADVICQVNSAKYLLFVK